MTDVEKAAEAYALGHAPHHDPVGMFARNDFLAGAAWQRAKEANFLGDIRQHCVCTRNVKGFDYGEKHPILGKPAAGKRWLTPVDMIDLRLGEFGRAEVPNAHHVVERSTE